MRDARLNDLSKGRIEIDGSGGFEYQGMVGDQKIGLLFAGGAYDVCRSIQCKNDFVDRPGSISDLKPRVIPRFSEIGWCDLVHDLNQMGYGYPQNRSP
jgi:hypothetical protein